MNMYKIIKTLAKLYYQRMWADYSGEQISRDLTSVEQISCTTACHSTAALLQTGTSILTLHRHFLWARYLHISLLVILCIIVYVTNKAHLNLKKKFLWAWAVTEQNDRAEYRLFANMWFWWRAKCSWRAGSFFSIGISSRNSRCL